MSDLFSDKELTNLANSSDESDKVSEPKPNEGISLSTFGDDIDSPLGGPEQMELAARKIPDVIPGIVNYGIAGLKTLGGDKSFKENLGEQQAREKELEDKYPMTNISGTAASMAMPIPGINKLQVLGKTAEGAVEAKKALSAYNLLKRGVPAAELAIKSGAEGAELAKAHDVLKAAEALKNAPSMDVNIARALKYKDFANRGLSQGVVGAGLGAGAGYMNTPAEADQSEKLTNALTGGVFGAKVGAGMGIAGPVITDRLGRAGRNAKDIQGDLAKSAVGVSEKAEINAAKNQNIASDLSEAAIKDVGIVGGIKDVQAKATKNIEGYGLEAKSILNEADVLSKQNPETQKFLASAKNYVDNDRNLQEAVEKIATDAGATYKKGEVEFAGGKSPEVLQIFKNFSDNPTLENLQKVIGQTSAATSLYKSGLIVTDNASHNAAIADKVTENLKKLRASAVSSALGPEATQRLDDVHRKMAQHYEVLDANLGAKGAKGIDFGTYAALYSGGAPVAATKAAMEASLATNPQRAILSLLSHSFGGIAKGANASQKVLQSRPDLVTRGALQTKVGDYQDYSNLKSSDESYREPQSVQEASSIETPNDQLKQSSPDNPESAYHAAKRPDFKQIVGETDPELAQIIDKAEQEGNNNLKNKALFTALQRTKSRQKLMA